jgi:hypothetical protein
MGRVSRNDTSSSSMFKCSCVRGLFCGGWTISARLMSSIFSSSNVPLSRHSCSALRSKFCGPNGFRGCLSARMSDCAWSTFSSSFGVNESR